MNTASLENCKRLYKLSGWRYSWNEPAPHYYSNIPIPAYNVGYLLRKLPPYMAEKKDKRKLLTPENSRFYWFTLQKYPPEAEDNEHLIDEWCCSYDSFEANAGVYNTDSFDASTFAEAPEDAICLLAIKLFEEGILKK